ncbi:MAG: 16S rRNA (cytidine(1402)-2'-O)-methyltransferase [Oscillospiraceae bacterium]|nr:16S rRNA (cytidine(1402)-2'-O)-methyltransferase [Oscillospiraceae bacterium]
MSEHTKTTEPGTLYVVATPIGNLADLSRRTASTLKEVDFIAAEDTRVTLKLLNHLEIKKPLISCFRHNEPDRVDDIINRILQGEDCALCCDAGTPAISDPGQLVVSAAHNSEINVITIPGPSAVIAALSVSGIPSGRFCFEGFIPMNKKTRKSRLTELQKEQRTMVFYEAPHKLRRTLSDLLEYLGDREIVIARELTKIYEETITTTLSRAKQLYLDNDARGEFVLIVSGLEKPEQPEYTLTDAAEIAKSHISNGMSISDAARQAAAETSFPRSQIYRAIIEESLCE